MPIFKGIAARLPGQWQTELKRIHFKRQIKKNVFVTDEPEFKILHDLVEPGDWVVDVGANIGHYSKRFSELVGAAGRVVAFEPVPETFSLLASNAQLFAYPNVSLINAAVSDKTDLVGMTMPTMSSGLANFYQAHITSNVADAFSVLALSLDMFCFDQRIKLVKIDVEGHESFALAGMRKLIEKDRPLLIVETDSDDVIADLAAQGYSAELLPGSPNVLFSPEGPGSYQVGIE